MNRFLETEFGPHEESLGDALLAALGCLILAPVAFFCLTMIAMGVPQ
jgi:hypothetical protein